MSRLPFSVYDFFGYLAAGFLLLVAGDYASDGEWLLRNSLGPAHILFFITVAYILGHIAANLSGFLLESWIVRRILGSPENLLLQDRSRGFKRLAFPGYYKPLPQETRKRILENARSRGGPQEPGRALFLHCFASVKKDVGTMSRLDSFLNLYGFSRNVSFAALVCAGLLWAGASNSSLWNSSEKEDLAWFSVAVSVGMFYRYLKFFRQYAYEVFVTYSEASTT